MHEKYRLASSDALIHHDLDSMSLIFDRRSGITHMIADPVTAIIEVMGDAAASVAAIAEMLSSRFDVEQEVDVAEIVLARLEELRDLGLVQREGDG
jgi:PqqD family protein of HPr-rel-A system